MRFFEQQEIARRNSSLLTLLFLVNVVVLSAVNALAVGTYFKFGNAQKISVFVTSTAIFIIATVISLIGGRSGTRIAEMLGGRVLRFPLQDLAEKRLYNVVEEMAIASGVPVPYVYVLDGDDSINAFAAGTDPKHIVVAVTRGALNMLSRDELQAVIGHEFSHILHEDMELNARTTGVVSGFYVFMRMGLWILRNSGDSRGSRRSRGDATVAIAFAGIAFLIFGSMGYFLARLIQSMISKQREFLADASSVQYTRNPQALARALAKIGYHSGSEIISPNRLEVSHIFFAEGMSGFWTGLFSTHPKIDDRIKSLLPNVPIEKFVAEMKQDFLKMETDHFQILSDESERFQKKISERKQHALAARSDRQTSADFIASIASPSVGHFHYTETSLAKIPIQLREKIQNPDDAKIALFAVLLFTQEESFENKFLNTVSEQNPESVFFLNECIKFCSQNLEMRLVFFKVILGVLRQGDDKGGATNRRELMSLLRSFFMQDQKMTLVESLYYLICDSVLGPDPVPALSQSIKDLRAVSGEIFRLLLACEFPVSATADEIKMYYQKIKNSLFFDTQFKLPTEFVFNLTQFKSDLLQLSRLNLNLKQKLILLFYENYKSGQNLTQQESEIMRLILLFLKMPIPPMIEKELSAV